MTPAIRAWAERWDIDDFAVNELLHLFRLREPSVMPADAPGTSEAAVQSAVRLEAARKGVRLWRNNVGALLDERGVPVRYGLANDSAAVNAAVKSGDLIGIRPVLITPAHVGSVIGQFVSRECKRVGWQYRGDKREQAQLAWAQLVTADGGDAAFCNGEGSL